MNLTRTARSILRSRRPSNRSAPTRATRGKRLVGLVGQIQVIAVAVRKVTGRQRWSKLAEWLNGVSPHPTTDDASGVLVERYRAKSP